MKLQKWRPSKPLTNLLLGVGVSLFLLFCWNAPQRGSINNQGVVTQICCVLAMAGVFRLWAWFCDIEAGGDG